MNEIGKRVCEVLGIDIAVVSAVTIEDIVNEPATATIQCPLTPQQVKRILLDEYDR